MRLFRRGLQTLIEHLVGEEQLKDNNTSLPDDPMSVVVKIEPEEPSNATFPSGPWVVLKRLRPEEILGRRQDDFEDNSTYKLIHIIKRAPAVLSGGEFPGGKRPHP
ncbi:unnamed protein product [Allacma fusca]|uniref:Uncharacterized protein n=1 Tax=Allacma fusca TaxID=39272 RepID=A0A8J2JRM6_9HEXA|nr:unnamed protein product [Allacma fusca]